MGKPLVIGGRHNRYSRIKNSKQYQENMDTIFGDRVEPRSVGRTRVRYVNGKKLVKHLDR